jgi:V/A-type H+-transporting ATPase subunit B
MLGQVLEISNKKAVVQLFDFPMGLNLNSKVKFTGKTAQFGVAENMLGYVFDGMGRPINDKTFTPEKYLDINGSAINPSARVKPNQYIETGISTIDLMSTLVRGQKLPIFSSAGLPHNELAAQIVKQANAGGEKFVVIFAGMGLTNEESNFFLDEFKKTGALEKTIVFLNKANDSSVERIMTPRLALTTAEYLAFEKEMHVLVVMTDFTNYCETLREISSARNEIPGRRGYPGYMYTDLAMNYERAGVINSSKGSITQIPILTMPSADRTHPVPDLTGYITEGQIALDENLSSQGISPPINPLPSLSRLMNNVTKKTREDHAPVKDQIYASYAQGIEVRQIVSVIGESSLSETDKKYLEFANRFEKEFINQGEDNRDLSQTLDISWQLLKILPRSELKKLKKQHIEKYLK